MTDDTGLFEQARHATPRRQHGYCTDEVARGLVVTSREADPSDTVLRLAECYLTVLTHAQDGSGAFHNRLSHDRRWTDEPGLGDWWGRALWGLGTAAARSPAPWIRIEALTAFTVAASRRSTALRAMTFAGLGAMWDPSTGGGYDGLTPHGPNLNQESTLAFISTPQHARSPNPPAV